VSNGTSTEKNAVSVSGVFTLFPAVCRVASPTHPDFPTQTN